MKCPHAGRLIFVYCFLIALNAPAWADATNNLSPISLRADPPAFIEPNIKYTDNTRTRITQFDLENRHPIELKLKLLRPFFFLVQGEVHQRLETNVFQDASNYKPDYAFRVTPTIYAGYRLTKPTALYVNYQVIKDVFSNYGTQLNGPTNQTVGFGVFRDMLQGGRTSVRVDLQAREIWSASHQRQAQLLPALYMGYLPNDHLTYYGTVILTLVSRELFQGATRELDPVYTVGFQYVHGNWTFNASTNLLTNFRSPPFSGTGHGNLSSISDFELDRSINVPRGGLLYFITAEPIWDWASGGVPGNSGFNFRLYNGLRYSFASSYVKARPRFGNKEQLPQVP